MTPRDIMDAADRTRASRRAASGPIPEAYRSKTARQALCHLGEECAEAAAACAKTARRGWWGYNPELPPEQRVQNIDMVLDEMANVERAFTALKGFLGQELKDGPDGAL